MGAADRRPDRTESVIVTVADPDGIVQSEVFTEQEACLQMIGSGGRNSGTDPKAGRKLITEIDICIQRSIRHVLNPDGGFKEAVIAEKFVHTYLAVKVLESLSEKIAVFILESKIKPHRLRYGCAQVEVVTVEGSSVDHSVEEQPHTDIGKKLSLIYGPQNVSLLPQNDLGGVDAKLYDTGT